MKNLFAVLLFITGPAFAFAQNLSEIIKPGTELIYRIDVKGKLYDLVATVKQLHPLSYSWTILDSANATGSITNTAKGERSATVLYSMFSPGNIDLNKNTTSLVLSKKCFNKFTGSIGKPISMQLSEGGERVGMGTYTGDNDFELKINGTTKSIKEELVKPLVKLGKKYMPTGDELITFYNSGDLPLILRMRSTYYMALLSITNK